MFTKQYLFPIFSVPILSGQDELSEAFSDLEVMVQKIKQKDADMYESRINEKELITAQQAMEFKMLASQINPHFLYNALESIRDSSSCPLTESMIS